MKIYSVNPLGRDTNGVQQAVVNQKQEDGGFAEALDKATGELSVSKLSSPEYLQGQITRYESKAETEDHETYINMMKYFKENVI